MNSRGVRRLLLSAVALVAASTVSAGTASAALPQEPQRLLAKVVVIGVPGLSWYDVKASPELTALVDQSHVGSITVKTAGPHTCPIDGWLTISAGTRAWGSVPDEEVVTCPQWSTARCRTGRRTSAARLRTTPAHHSVAWATATARSRSAASAPALPSLWPVPTARSTTGSPRSTWPSWRVLPAATRSSTPDHCRCVMDARRPARRSPSWSHRSVPLTAGCCSSASAS